MLGFIIWALMGAMFIGTGVYSFYSKKPMGFWANIKLFDVSDYKNYNRAFGKLFCVYGIVFIILGLPLLKGQDSPFLIFSVIGILLESIAAMIVYTLYIEEKYRKK